MNIRPQNFFNLIHYLPGVVILVFGMLALHSSLSLMEANREMVSAYEQYTHLNFESAIQKENRAQDLSMKEAWLYWSVLAIGFSGFLLVVLNTDKLRKLRKANEEKKLTLDLLKSRLAAMEASRDGLAIVGEDGTLKYMNNALMKMHNISEDEAHTYIGNSWEALYSQKGREDILKGRKKIQEAAQSSLQEKGYWRGESPIAKKNGEIINAELSLTLLPDGGFIGTVRDISDRKKIEAERKDLENQFYQAQKMEAIGRLAGGIAHDFNNILAAMNGYAEFLIDDLEEKSPQHQFAVNILQAGRQARDLVDQMLAFSRRKESSKNVLDLTTPIYETLSMLQATLPKTIDVRPKINATSASINGNANQIAQVIMNLCVNAKDAIEDAHGTLKVELDIIQSSECGVVGIPVDSIDDFLEMPPIRLEELSPGRTRLVMGQILKDTDYVCLSVEDTGCGMSKIIMERIFEPFFTTKPIDKGTGLGLSTVHGVIAGHKGAMIVDSTLGKGTRFDLYFPLAESIVEEEVDSESDIIDEAATGRILLVEDEDSVRTMLLTMLERLGYEAKACETGLEALDMLRENPGLFDLVLTDHNMPKMTGLELAQQIVYDFPQMPFILLSGYSEERLRELMDENPAIKAILRKPIAKNALAQKIQAVLSAQKIAA